MSNNNENWIDCAGRTYLAPSNDPPDDYIDETCPDQPVIGWVDELDCVEF